MKQEFRVSRPVRDAALTAALLSAATLLCSLMMRVAEGESYVGFVYVLAVVFVSRWTEGYVWGILASFFGVVCVNYVFTFPYWEINFLMTGYPLTFVTLLAVSVVVSTMTTQIKRQERERLQGEREAIRADLLRAMSHDIRTPLTSIVGNTAAVLEDTGTLSEEQKRALLRDVNEDAQWLIRMVENILSVTRMHGGEGEIVKDYEAPEEIIDAAARKFAKRFPHTEVLLEAPEEVLMVPMDAMLIQQVLLNLMENAVIHGGASRIRIHVGREGSTACFAVSDNGCGLPPERLATAFDALATAHRGRSDRKKNMGIGLSVCRGIIKAHGGTVTAENRPEGGACFRFALPLQEDGNGRNDEGETRYEAEGQGADY
ncbi:MAG: PAS domain-containing sensor histidine kinase [Oscillospiraceae bacterium]|nr:PAS domain-containing sensor histidine kinase [Oscillospiraceae bacterium]